MSMTPPLDERTYTFVVRLWEERRDIPGALPVWRGSATEVTTRSSVYFNSLGELCEFLSSQCGIDVSAPSDVDRASKT